MPAPISGILTPHMVPLDDAGRIDEAELRRYVSWLVDRGVHGLYPNGSTGEFLRFTAEERRLITTIDVATVRTLAEECPRITGIKDSSGDISHMGRLIAAVRPVRPDFAFLTGWDAALVPMLAIGCDGGTNASSGVLPELTRAVFDEVRAGNLAAAFDLQRRLTELFDALFLGVDFPEGFRAGVELRGFRMGPSRQPATPQQHADRDRLAARVGEILRSLGVDPDRPAAAAALP